MAAAPRADSRAALREPRVASPTRLAQSTVQVKTCGWLPGSSGMMALDLLSFPQRLRMLSTLSLTALATRSEDTPHVRRSDLRPGDRLVVFTRNSSYVIVSTGDGSYQVSGGWFDRNGVSPATVSIAGCTFGGSAICTDLVAAKGLF